MTNPQGAAAAPPLRARQRPAVVILAGAGRKVRSRYSGRNQPLFRPDRLVDVVGAYWEGLGRKGRNGHAMPTQTVSDRFGISYSTAHHLVDHARALGMLPPVRRGSPRTEES